jgi:DNA-binding NtrC family response regulator
LFQKHLQKRSYSFWYLFRNWRSLGVSAMTWKPCVLVVAPTPRIATTLFAWLSDAGCSPLVVSSFAAAKQHLDDRPCFLVSEVRLGEYNGLHLALRAQAPGIPVVLIGEPDPVLQREAAQLGATYLTIGIDAQELLAVVQTIVEAADAASRNAADSVRVKAAWPPATGLGSRESVSTDVPRGDIGTVSFVSVSSRTRLLRPSNPVRS